jgi:hypothetical protein
MLQGAEAQTPKERMSHEVSSLQSCIISKRGVDQIGIARRSYQQQFQAMYACMYLHVPAD